jgi:hypothetical protein
MRYKSIPALNPRQQNLFWNKVHVSQPSGCWQWTGAVSRLGYGKWSATYAAKRQHVLTAHRVAFTLLIGNIPTDMTLDHLCRNRGCVNPDHMQVVTLKENIHRSFHPSIIISRSDTCSNGHREFYFNAKGKRICKACARERQALCKARKKARALP